MLSPFSLGHPRFFLGSDSAPHPPSKKSNATPSSPCAAGVYTSPILLPLTAHLLESFGALDNLEGFVSRNGRAFYRKPARESEIVVLKRTKEIVNEVWTKGEDSVVPFWAGKELNWEIASS